MTKKIIGSVTFIVVLVLILYTTIASAVLNANLQITGEANFVPDHTVINNFSYTGACENFTISKSGIYKLETWGAEGGNTDSAMSGKGGYATGTLTLFQDTQLYVCVGGKGKSGAVTTGEQILTGGFNGGGNAWGYSDGNNGSGGGATDIRIEANSLYARVIVAGGGGGAVSAGAGTQQGHGGGTSGLTAQTSFGGGCSANGGTQSAGGTGNSCGSGFSPGSTGTTYNASFGQGGNGRNVGITENRSGGGGGWYGGGSSFVVGGGGSGFVWASGVSVPSGYTLTANHYLSNTQNINGGSSMPKYDGAGNMTGNTGDGYARITFTKPVLDKIKFYLNGSADIEINVGGVYSEAGATLYINNVDTSSSVSITGNVDTSTAGTYIKTYSYTYNSTNYVLKRRILVKNTIAYTKNFSYTGSQQSDSVPYTGWYKIETWGAEGGNGQNSDSGVGGKGGYTTGIVWLTSGTTLYAYIGQQGIKYSSGNYAPATFNGGGSGGQNYLCSSSAVRGGSGGGASDIRIGGTTYYERLIVAGGGGGGSSRTGINGGAGGGSTGNDGGGGSGGGKGGTQTAGGSAGTTGINERDANQKNGGFGTGGYSHVYVIPSTARTAYTGSGGGGGWYGGGAGNNSSTGLITCVDNGNGGAGGGGSSFIWKSGASTPSGYNVSTNYHMGGTSTTSGTRSGNGYATITFLQP